MVSVYAYDAAYRVAHSARQVFTALGIDEELPRPSSVDTVAARRWIAETVIDAGTYPW